MAAIAVLLGVAIVLFGLYEYAKIRKLRRISHRASRLFSELYQEADWHSPQGQEIIRQIIAAFHQARQVDPEVEKQLDVERTIASLADFLGE